MFTFVPILVFVFARKPLYTRVFSYRLGKRLKQLVKVTVHTTITNIYFFIMIKTSVQGRMQRANALHRKVIKPFRKNTQKRYKKHLFSYQRLILSVFFATYWWLILSKHIDLGIYWHIRPFMFRIVSFTTRNMKQ